MKDLPCADCGLVLTVRVKQDRTADGVPILCDPCLQARVVRIRSGETEEGPIIWPKASRLRAQQDVLSMM